MPEAINQFLYRDEKTGVSVWLKRLDTQFANSYGNKVYKLKYNIAAAKRQQKSTLLTFGGAFSNHIATVAALGKHEKLNTIGVIRGEELGKDLAQTLAQNPTLRQAKKEGMLFEFISRAAYREKDTPLFRESLFKKFGEVYVLPEGGTNVLAVKGCEEIVSAKDVNFDVICCAVGTGGTISGLINAAATHQQVVGFSALKANLEPQIKPFVCTANWKIFSETYFGGFAKINKELVSFINTFKHQYGVLLDPIYTGKMMYHLQEKIQAGYFPKNSCILAVHTGGLQSILGMNERLKQKGLPTINY